MKSELRTTKRSMVTRLLRVVFGFYLVVVVGSTIGQMVVEYRYQRDNIRKEFLNIQATFEHVLAGEIWNLDQKALHSTVMGMIELPGIVGMKIHNENGQIIAIGQLAGGIAHDFNNILAAMFGFVELAREDVADPKELTFRNELDKKPHCGS